MLSVTPFLWFDTQAEDAVKFYASIFPNSQVLSVSGPPGHVMSATLELEGQKIIAFNGGPHFKFNEAISFSVGCDTQQEIDTYWAKLTADGGSPSRCGWLKDKYGLSWQVVPNNLGRLLGGGGDPGKAQRAMQAMMQMSKLDIAGLEQA